MSDPAASLKLHAWLSPGFPVGAFAYSHGLERAVADGDVRCRETLTGWLDAILRFGAGRSDAIILAAAWRDPEDAAPAELARTLQPSAERRRETEAQGAAFAEIAGAARPAAGLDGAPVPYPVAVGRVARAHGVPLAETLPLFLQAFAANLVSAAVRLVPLGQTDGQRALAALGPACLAVAEEAAAATLDDVGGAAIRVDLASLGHETQAVRLFRS